MKFIKLISILTILSSTSIIGFAYGNIFGKRAKNLIDLEYCIRLLESEILIGNTPLPEALDNIYKKGKGEVSNLFKEIREDLITTKREDIYISFQLQKDSLKDKYLFKPQDIEVILFLGRILGKTNRIDQEKNFKFILKQIEDLSIDASEEKETYEKLYRSLGILMGMGIIIIFI